MSLTSRWLARARSRDRAKRAAEKGPKRPSIKAIDSPGLERKVMLQLLAEQGKGAQSAIFKERMATAGDEHDGLMDAATDAAAAEEPETMQPAVGSIAKAIRERRESKQRATIAEPAARHRLEPPAKKAPFRIPRKKPRSVQEVEPTLPPDDLPDLVPGAVSDEEEDGDAASVHAAEDAPAAPPPLFGRAADKAKAAAAAALGSAAPPDQTGRDPLFGEAPAATTKEACSFGRMSRPATFGRRADEAAAAAAAASAEDTPAEPEPPKEFEGQEEAAEEDKDKVVEQIFELLPQEWSELLLTFGHTPTLSAAVRLERAKKRLRKAEMSVCLNIRRALTSLVPWMKEMRLEETFLFLGCLTADVCIAFLEDYDEGAQERAQERAAKREAAGLPPRRNDRGGKTACMPIFRGLDSCRKRLGLPFCTEPEEVKEVARCGHGMPAPQPMVNLHDCKTLEETTVDERKTRFERAYAGGGWLTIAGSTRVIDLQRTPKLRFERSSVLGRETTICCGEARKSKARRAKEMRPLPWRAAMIPIGGGDVDLQPLINSMPNSDKGCVFRDFETAPGVAHVITNATAWANKPASHETIVNSLRVLTGNGELGGHNGRHVLPEVGRVLELPKQSREALGYWRVTPVIGDATDARALARAMTKARERRTRAGALASCADRYSSIDAAPVEQDKARVACMLACRALFESGMPPASSSEQIQAISTAQSDEAAA